MVLNWAFSCLVLCGFWQTKTTPVIFIIGDSTAAQKTEQAFPETGWGMCLGKYLSAEVRLENHAVNGRSTLSFRNEKRWDSIVSKLKKDDVVLIQFGHNDQKIDKVGVGSSPEDYALNLKNYVLDTRAKGAFPILITSIARRNFQHGEFVDTHGSYPDKMREVALELKVPLIDMHQISSAEIKAMGEASSITYFNHLAAGHKNYPNGIQDNTHFSETGAEVMAGHIASALKKIPSPIITYIK